ncbi:hypothetical protein WA026_011460 [Henosepilachna vigintioctopunctata]|uniref:Peptidase S1 domain-containing protein n=1 Tax=Henosepilachna vigintioctopunctata TaxID=420089 RepID=A0AAW1TS56_9CUCU
MRTRITYFLLRIQHFCNMIRLLNIVLTVLLVFERVGNISTSRFIVGGYFVAIDDFPFMVSVRNATFFYCGGVILSPRVVITAAHCIFQDEGLLVKAGTDDLRKNGTIGKVEKVIKHPLHNGDLYDLALLKLEEPLEYSPQINNVTLPDFSNEIKVKEGISIGWGWTQIPEDDTNHLRAIKLLVEDVCRDKTKSTFCVNHFRGNACRGDSGGPFVSDGVLYGIISSGPIPCGNGLPAIMVNIPFLVEWIKTNANIL